LDTQRQDQLHIGSQESIGFWMSVAAEELFKMTLLMRGRSESP